MEMKNSKYDDKLMIFSWVMELIYEIWILNLFSENEAEFQWVVSITNRNGIIANLIKEFC